MGDASGYEIKKLLEGPFCHIYEASFGSIYPALYELLDEGLVTCEAYSQKKRPDKKVYRLNGSGHVALLADLKELPGPDVIRSDFFVMMLCAHSLPPTHVKKAINKRLDIYRDLITSLEQLDAPGEGHASPELSAAFVRGYGLAMLKAGVDYLQENRHLVDTPAIQEAPVPRSNQSEVIS